MSLIRREPKSEEKIWVEASSNCNGFCSNTFQPIWFSMHMISLDYPIDPTREDSEKYRNWFLLQLQVLPCSACRENVKEALKKSKWDPIVDMANRTAFAKAVWALHRQVNIQLGKPNIEFEDMCEYYEQLRASSCNTESCTLPRNSLKCRIVIEKEGSSQR